MERAADTGSAGPDPGSGSVGRGALWFAGLGGILAWSIHLTASYALVPYMCMTGRELPLHLLTALAAVVAASAMVAGWRLHRQLLSVPPIPEAAEWTEDLRTFRPAARARIERFLALFGTLLSAFFLTLILVEGLQVLFFVDPCRAIPTEDSPIILMELEGWMARWDSVGMGAYRG